MSPEQIIEQWVAAARAAADTDDLQIGENISTHPAIKIAFDGYAEDDDGVEDLDRESTLYTSIATPLLRGSYFPSMSEQRGRSSSAQQTRCVTPSGSTLQKATSTDLP